MKMPTFLRRLNPSPTKPIYRPDRDPIVIRAQKELHESKVQRSLLQGTLQQEPTGFFLGDAVIGRRRDEENRQ